MRLSSSSLLALMTVILAIAFAHASPLPFQDAQVDALARSMFGPNENTVSWESVPFERSPSDPDSDIKLERRIVYNPPITYPTKHTVWTAGQHVHVDWAIEKKDLPENAKDPIASIFLGYLVRGSDFDEHLNWKLVDNFSITDKSASFILPSDLVTRDDYIVVLFGDSGNRSERFTIKAKTVKTTASRYINENAEGSKVRCIKESNVVETASDSLLGRDLD